MARPVPTRAASRSRSYAWPSASRRSAAERRRRGPARRPRRAARRSASGAVSGEVSQSASSRAPIGVTVRSITWSSEPSRLPSRRVRVSSRLRRVISSSARRLAAAVGGQPGDVADRRSSGSRGGRRPGPRRPGPRGRRRRSPKPARVVVPNCSKRALRACSGWKSHDGRDVIARPGWPAERADPGGVEAQSPRSGSRPG